MFFLRLEIRIKWSRISVATYIFYFALLLKANGWQSSHTAAAVDFAETATHDHSVALLVNPDADLIQMNQNTITLSAAFVQAVSSSIELRWVPSMRASGLIPRASMQEPQTPTLWPFEATNFSIRSIL